MSLIINSSVGSRYGNFMDLCGEIEFQLTPHSEISPYALCFAIFGRHLIRDQETINRNQDVWDKLLRQNLTSLRRDAQSRGQLLHNKPYMQLLTFTLSALFILGTLKDDPLEETTLNLLPNNVSNALEHIGVREGRPGSGNLAMFIGIILLHIRDWLGKDVQSELDSWIEFHTNYMNKFGFWGNVKSMSHLQFQNGYHQYELFEFLNTDLVPWDIASDAVASLSDKEGHFAPYPGGGGCYDYDAVFILTAAGSNSILRHNTLLKKTADSILSEQNKDGGFCESHYIRPHTYTNLKHFWNHIWSAQGRARVERIRYGLTLQRVKHNRVHTHWTQYSRKWSESDLWDSWFRMLTVARIDVALDPAKISEWGFIDYPGIGYHSLLEHK